MRSYSRENNQIRPYSFETNFTKNADASVLVRCGETVVLCTANVETKVPPWLEGKAKGWITAEYSMLPGSTLDRIPRGKGGGRTQEIQRLIGRSLRAVADLSKMPDVSIMIDCDVLQADGGTRTASICGGWVVLKLAIDKLLEYGKIKQDPITSVCSAISVGLVDNQVLVDLDYSEDSNAQVDMNLVMADDKFIEIQGTGEESTFTFEELNELISAGKQAINEISVLQQKAVSK